jgi:hypothetical protein
VRIDDALRDLEGMQDSITHLNEAGPSAAGQTRNLIAAREKLHREIVEYVTNLEALRFVTITEEATDDTEASE